MKFRTLTYAVIGTLLFFAFRPTAVDAVQTQTTTVPASRGKTEQTGTFQAGPGIAIATTESGKVQGYVQDGFTTIATFLMQKRQNVLNRQKR